MDERDQQTTEEQMRRILDDSEMESPVLYRLVWSVVIVTILLSILIGPSGCNGPVALP